jgi:hypothetical protein
MTNILVTNSLTETTVISFIQNRLIEFYIDDSDIEPYLYTIAINITNIIGSHFSNSFHLPTEEDLYYDEINCEYTSLLTEIKSFDLKDDKLKKLIFVVTKVLDQIIIEAKEQQLFALTDLTRKTEKLLLNLS